MLSKNRSASGRYLMVVLVAAAVLSCVSLSGIAQSAPSLEGTWEVIVTTSSGRVFTSLITYMKGGGMLLTENGGTPAVFNAGQGTWVKDGGHEFAFRWKRFHFDPAGNFLFTLQVSGHVELEPGFQEYVGFGVADMILPDGTVIPAVSATTTYGTRLLVE